MLINLDSQSRTPRTKRRFATTGRWAKRAALLALVVVPLVAAVLALVVVLVVLLWRWRSWRLLAVALLVVGVALLAHDGVARNASLPPLPASPRPPWMLPVGLPPAALPLPLTASPHPRPPPPLPLSPVFVFALISILAPRALYIFF